MNRGSAAPPADRPATRASARLSSPTPGRRWFPVGLCTDLVWCLLAYAAIDSTLLEAEGLLTRGQLVVSCSVSIVVLIGLLVVARAGDGETRHARRLVAIAFEVIVFAGLFWLAPRVLVYATASKGSSNLWYGMDWHRFWMNGILILRAAPIESVLFVVLLVSLVATHQRSRAGGRILCTSALALVPIALVARGEALIDSDVRTLHVFAIPLVPAVLMCPFPSTRVFTRLALAGGSFALVGMFYLGLVPVRLDSAPPALPAWMTRIYPSPGEHSEFPLMFLRELVVLHDPDELFLSYGPTCGIARIGLDGGGLRGIVKVKGMMRRIWATTDQSHLLGLDDLAGDFNVFTRSPFQLERTEDLFQRDRLVSPFWFDLDPARRRLFILTYEDAELLEYQLQDDYALELIRRVSLRDLGITQFRSGGQRVLYDPRRDVLLVLAGIVDARLDYVIAEVDRPTFTTRRIVRLKEANMVLYEHPSRRLVYTTSFYGTAIQEFDRDTLARRRVIDGPLSSRSIAIDPVRSLLFAGGYARGDFDVIDFQSGKALWRGRLGRRVATLQLVPRRSSLLVTADTGIFEVDLDALERSLGRTPDRSSMNAESREPRDDEPSELGASVPLPGGSM